VTYEESAFAAKNRRSRFLSRHGRIGTTGRETSTGEPKADVIFG